MNEVLRKKLHFLYKMLFKFIILNFLYYFGHIEDVFLFLIYFSGCLIWLLLIFIEKVCTLVLLLRLVWYGRRKIFLSVSWLFGTILFGYLWIYLNFHWKLKIVINWDIFCIIKNNICCILDIYMPKKPTTAQFHKKFEILKFLYYRNVIIFIL